MPELKHPVRNINNSLLERLELVSTDVKPLPGAVGRRVGDVDPRLSNLKPNVGLGNISDTVCYYEHLSTIRCRRHLTLSRQDEFFVAFRQTMDALLLEQSNAQLYPEFLMKSDVKKTELKVYIYQVTALPRTIPILRSHEDWLKPIGDPGVFDTIAYFLLTRGVFTEEMYGSIQ